MVYYRKQLGRAFIFGIRLQAIMKTIDRQKYEKNLCKTVEFTTAAISKLGKNESEHLQPN